MGTKRIEQAGVGLADVRDVADAHTRAMTVDLTEPGVANKFGQARFLVSTKRSYSVVDIVTQLKRAGFGGFDMPTKTKGVKKPRVNYGNDRVQNVLGVKFTSIFDTLTDTVESLKAKGLVTPKNQRPEL